MNTQDLIARPSEHYAEPHAAVSDPRLDADQKRRLLANWRDELEQRQQAEQEGLVGEPSVEEFADLHAAEAGLDGSPTLAPGTRKLAGVFASRVDAERACHVLVREAGADASVSVVGPQDIVTLSGHAQDEAASMAADTARGGVAGAGGMAAGLGALSVVDVVVAAPIALSLAGLGGVLGGVASSLGSQRLRDPDFLELVREAQAQGHWLVTVELDSEAGALAMQDVLARTAARETIDHGGVRQAVGH